MHSIKSFCRASWFAALFFVLVASVGYSPEKARSYGALSDLAVSVSDSTKSATATYTFTFTTSTAIPRWGSVINIQFFGPSGSSSGSSWVNNYPNSSNPTIDSDTSPSSINSCYGNSWGSLYCYTNQAIAAGTTVTLKMGNIINPATGGYHFVHVWTSAYGTNLDGSANWSSDYNSPYFEIGGNTNFKGTITDSDGVTPVPFTSVSVYNYNGSSWASYYTYTDKNGEYGFGDVSAGTYTYSIYGPYTYGSNKTYFAPNNASVTVTSSQTTTRNSSFLATTKTVSGTITKNSATGTAVTNATVSIYKQNGNGYASTTVNSLGEYSFQVTGGTWQLSIYATNWPADWSYAWSDKDKVTFADDSTTESKTHPFIVDSVNSTVKGRIVKSTGAALSSSWSTSLNFANAKNQYFYANVGADGSFETKVSAGTYKVSGYTSEAGFSLPKIDNFDIEDSKEKDFGNIVLSEKTDIISGTILDNTGAGVANVSVYAWKDDPYDWANATTDANGSYSMLVAPGTWRVSAWPQWNSGYIYSGDPKNVTVTSGVTATANFTFKKCTATINGKVTDPDGNVLDTLSSWASASDGSKEWGNIGASVTNGAFTLQVPAGTWDVSVYIYGSDYGSPDPKQVTVIDNETTSIALAATKNDATLQGTVKDDQGIAVTGKWMSIYATKGKYGSWMNANLNQEDGTYSMKLSAGTWKLGWWIDKSLGYSSGTGEDVEVNIPAGQTVTQNISLKKADSTISGTAKKADGSVMSWAWITADSRNPNEKKTSSMNYWSNGASSDVSGNYELKVPAGTYWVGGSMWSGSGYINPKRQEVTVDAATPAIVNLVFRTADATITGTVANGGATQAYITAWSEDGGYADANSDNSGVYTLNVSSGTKWHLKASKKIEKDVYKSSEYIVDLTELKTATQDIHLEKQSYTLPAAQSISFDPTKQQTVTLGDETVINIPANTLATSGTVTLSVEPESDLAEEADAKPLDYGYEITATTETGSEIKNFNGYVTIQDSYDEDTLTESGISDEEDLAPAYYDETTSTWKDLENVTVNADENTVTYQTNHFTKFALVSATDTTPPGTPTSVSATAGDTKVTLTWSNPTDTDLAGIKIYRSMTAGTVGDLVTTISNTTTGTYEDAGLTNGTTYYYVVRAYDTSGNVSTNTTQVSAQPVAATSTSTSTAGTATLPVTGSTEGNNWQLPLIVVAALVCGRGFLRRVGI